MELWKSVVVTLGLLLPLCFGSQCPDRCTCTTESTNITVLCTSENITAFPANLSPQSLAVTLIFTSVASIELNAFVGLTQLERLDLSNNKLTGLPDGLFRDLLRLNSLDLTNNILQDLPAGIFNTIVALKTLVLSGNRLATMNPSWFENLEKLEFLDVSNNRFQSVPLDCFFNLLSLMTLDLSHNDLQVLPEGLFFGQTNLERLNLENTSLSSIYECTFAKTPNLRFLFLQHNNLKNLPATLFHPLTLLDTLDLSHNILRSVPSGLFSQNVKIGSEFQQGVDLSGNPWRCDCCLTYLRQWVEDHAGTLYSINDTLCTQPKELEGQRLIEAEISYIKKSCDDDACSKDTLLRS